MVRLAVVKATAARALHGSWLLALPPQPRYSSSSQVADRDFICPVHQSPEPDVVILSSASSHDIASETSRLLRGVKAHCKHWSVATDRDIILVTGYRAVGE